jgi:hypothetical protein
MLRNCPRSSFAGFAVLVLALGTDALAADMKAPWMKPQKDDEVSSSQYPWQYKASRSYMPPWITTRRMIGPLGGSWVSWPDWRSVVWTGDEKGSALHRRSQAHSLAIEQKLDRLHDWSHPSLSPDYEYLFNEPPPKIKD